MLVAAVQELLEHGLRRARCASHAGIASVEVDAGSEQVDGNLLIPVADRVVRFLDGQAMGEGRDVAVSEFPH